VCTLRSFSHDPKSGTPLGGQLAAVPPNAGFIFYPTVGTDGQQRDDELT